MNSNKLPVDILTDEHSILLKYAEELVRTVGEIKLCGSYEASAEKLKRLMELTGFFKSSETHYVREENVIFPYLEKHGVTGPTSVMWSEHDEIRKIKKGLYSAIDNYQSAPFQETVDKLTSVSAALFEMLSGHFMKENNILFPMARRLFTESEWTETVHQFSQIGYCPFTPEVPKVAEKKVRAETGAEGERMVFETGKLLPKEIEAIFNTLPVDITFIDKDDLVKYFNQPAEMLFARTKAIIGNRVQNCHPKKSVHMVNKIIEEFRSGTRQVAEFWLTLNGKLVYIRYFPVRSKAGEYLGCMEVSQNITGIKKIEGEKRLLEWD